MLASGKNTVVDALPKAYKPPTYQKVLHQYCSLVHPEHVFFIILFWIPLFRVCHFPHGWNLVSTSVTGSHSGPSSEKQSPMTQKHSPQTQPSPVAQSGQGGSQPGQTATQAGQAPAQPGQTPAQTSQTVTGPPAPAASQPAPAGTQHSPVTQPSGPPPQLYLHDGR